MHARNRDAGWNLASHVILMTVSINAKLVIDPEALLFGV